MIRRCCLSACLLTLLPVVSGAAEDKPLPQTVQFNRDIRPILADNCFACHGPDKHKRKADLRLNVQDDVYSDRGGYRILVPGQPAKSELFRRITAATKHRMPPTKFGKRLTAREVSLIHRWIDQGGKMGRTLGLPARPSARAAGRARPALAPHALRQLHPGSAR